MVLEKDEILAQIQEQLEQRMQEGNRSQSPLEITENGFICKASKVTLTITLPEEYIGCENYLYLEGLSILQKVI